MVGKGSRFRRRLTALTAAFWAFCLSAGAEEIPLVLQSGRVLRARLSLPVRAAAQPRSQIPVLLVFGGFQKAGEVIELMRRTGLGEDYALASFDYPFEPPRKIIFPESLFWIPKLHQMVHETFEGIRILDARLSEDFRFDPRRRILLGASLGAPMALGAIHRGARPTHLALIHGFGAFESVVAWQFERPWQKSWGSLSCFAPSVSKALARALLWRSGVGSAENWAENLPEGLSVLQVSPREDEFVPRSAIESLEDSLRRSKAKVEFRKTQAGHLQPGAIPTLQEIGVLLQKWLASDQAREKPPRDHQSNQGSYNPKGLKPAPGRKNLGKL